MRITYITDSYPPVVNGVSYVVANLAENLARQGHEVKVITIDSTFSLPHSELRNDVLIRRVVGFRPAGSYHIPTPQIIREINVSADVIHAHNFHGVMPLVSALSLHKSPNCLAVVTPHYHTMGHHLHSKIAWVPYKRFLQKAIEKFDVIQTVSQFESEVVGRDFGVKSVIIENGIPSDVYDWQWQNPQSGDVFRMLYVGRLERYKRIDLVLEAASIVQQGMTGHSRVEVDIVGIGSEAHSIISKAKNLNLRVNMHLNVPRAALLQLYSTTNCLVNCSRFEAFSIVTAEALAIGTPVVIVYPWGINFKDYPRAAVVPPEPMSIAEAILQSRSRALKERKHIPTWSESVQKMVKIVYARAET